MGKWGAQVMSLDEAYHLWWLKTKSAIKEALRAEHKAMGKLTMASGAVHKRLFPSRDSTVQQPPRKVPHLQAPLAPETKKGEFCPFLRRGGTCRKGDKCDWSHDPYAHAPK